MHHDLLLLGCALAAIGGLVVLVARLRVHPFIALTLVSGALGLATGMPPDRVARSFEDGFGSVLGFVGVVLALGAVLGKLMAESGAADRIARTLVSTFGRRRAHWAMLAVGFIVGLPLFFEVGFMLLLPLAFSVARESELPVLQVSLALLAGLSAAHGLIPPHPGPLLTVAAFGADMGRTLVYGLIVGVPAAALAGPVFGAFVARRVRPDPAASALQAVAAEVRAKAPPTFAAAIATLLLPVLLMMLKAVADFAIASAGPGRRWLDFLGDPVTALTLAVLAAFYAFGTRAGFSRRELLRLTEEGLVPIAALLVIIGAGGGFKQTLVDSGVGEAIGRLAFRARVSPLLLAWLAAGLIRAATGSATVAAIAGAGLVAPLAAHGASRELLALATGAGSLMLSHVNDAGFWLVQGTLGLSVGDTFRTWTALETLLSVAAILLILALGTVV